MTKRVNIILSLFIIVSLPVVSGFSKGIFEEYTEVFVMILLLCIALASRLKDKIYLNQTDIPVAVLIIYGGLNLWVNTSACADTLVLWQWISAGLVYVWIRTSTDTERFVVLCGLSASGFIQSVIALGQLWKILVSHHSYFEVTGSFGNPGQLGGYLAVCFVVSIGLAKRFWTKKISGPCFSYLPELWHWLFTSPMPVRQSWR